MFSLYQIASAYIPEWYITKIKSELVLSDIKLEKCCRGIITGYYNKDKIISESIRHDHLECFKRVNIILDNVDYYGLYRLFNILRSFGDVSDIFKFIVDRSTVTYKSLLICSKNPAHVAYIMKKHQIYIPYFAYKYLILNRNHVTIQVILSSENNFEFPNTSNQRLLITMCIVKSSFDVFKVLVENNFIVYEDAIIDMIIHKRYDMIVYTLAMYNSGSLNMNLYRVIFTAVNSRDYRILKIFENILNTNDDILVMILSLHISVLFIIDMYNIDMISNNIVYRVFEYSVITNDLAKCEEFMQIGFVVSNEIMYNKIIENNLKFIIMCNSYGTVFDESFLRMITIINDDNNAYTIGNDIIKFITRNLKLHNQIVKNEWTELFHIQNRYVFKQLIKYGFLNHLDSINDILNDYKGLFFIKTISKYMTKQQLVNMYKFTITNKMYYLSMYLFIKI